MGAHLSQPFQHQAIDSCHTIPCTKCHLSYYKFSAEYSADPMGLRTKREHWQGHLWNARRELPPSLGCEAVQGHWGFEFDTDSCDFPPCLSKVIAHVFFSILTIYIYIYMQYHMLILDLWFIQLKEMVCTALNGINTLVTFRQPWHNWAINVTDSFAGSSWLVLNHN